MGRLTSAVHWWEESQMRVLVLTSLVIQFLLFIFSVARSHAIHRFFRFVMWIAYLASDAVAIYALATLFNRHKDQDRGGGRTLELEVAWAPILLIHLGGHDGITAYNIEDNELWSRHLLTAVSQVTVAIYVFWKSWLPGGDKRLLQASILLFVSGVLKCFTKPFALKRASITSLVSSPAAKRTKKGEMDPHSLEKYVKRAKAFVQEQKDEGNKAQSERACVENGDHPPPQQAKQNKDEMDLFEEYVKRKRDFVVGEQKDEDGAQGDSASVEDEWEKECRRQQILRREAYKLFVDLSSDRRLSMFKYFWELSQEKPETTTTRKSNEDTNAETAYGYVRRGLASAFLLLYTKLKTAASDFEDDSPVTATGFFCLLWIMLSRYSLPWAAIGLFHQSHREAYNDIDVKITYALLCCTAVLECSSICSVYYTDTPGVPLVISRERWPDMVAQYSLIRYFARNKNHGKLMWIASKLGCRDLVDRHWCMEPCSSSSSRRITELVLGYLRDGWKEKIHDPISYLRFNDNRGHCALEGHEDELGWSIKAPFDESVLLWHIATDLCFFSSLFSQHTCAFAKTLSTCSDSEGDASPAQKAKCATCTAVQCRRMSNYMVYLLFVNPEMLLPGTRRNLFTAAYDDLKLKDKSKKQDNGSEGESKQNPQSCCHYQHVEEKDLMKTLIKTMQDRSKKQDNGSEEESKQEGQPNGENFIDDAWDLAKVLLKLRNDLGDEKMWKVIQGVWVEMLCFSASRCRGYLHAKALGSGGEFLSYVWLLLFYMGMETFTERLERGREVLPCHEGNNSAAQAPRASDAHNGSVTTSSTSQVRSRGASSPSYLHTGASTSNSKIPIADIV